MSYVILAATIDGSVCRRPVGSGRACRSGALTVLIVGGLRCPPTSRFRVLLACRRPVGLAAFRRPRQGCRHGAAPAPALACLLACAPARRRRGRTNFRCRASSSRASPAPV